MSFGAGLVDGHMVRGLFSALVAITFALSLTPRAEAQPVAFPRVTGPKPAGRGLTASGVQAGLEEAGLEVERGETLKDAADELGTTVYDPDVAIMIGCEYLAVVKLSGRRGRFKARGALMRLDDKEVILRTERRYKTKKRAQATGMALGREFAAAILRSVPESSAEALSLEEPETVPEMVVEPTAAEAPLEEPENEARSTDIKVDLTQAGVGSGAYPWENRTFRMGLSAGSRAYTSYVIQVGNVATAHSYTLDPLLAASANLAFTIPSTPVEMQAQFLWTPVRFGVSTLPATDPVDPAGQLFGAGGNAGWRFELRRNLRFTPFVGVDYSSTLVELQSPITVINEFSTLSVGGGLRIAIDVLEALSLELEGDAGWIVDFTEGQVTTGEPQDGLRISSRLRARWWVLAPVGFEISGRHEYRRISLRGASTRAEFAEDPAISDASITTEAIDLMAGLVVAL